MLMPLHRLIDIDDKHNPVIFRRHLIELNDNLLIIAIACAGQVIAHVLDSAGPVLQIAKVNDILAIHQLAVLQQDRRRIAVNGLRRCGKQSAEQAALSGRLHLIPAQTNNHSVEAFLALFGQADFLALL